MEVIIVFAIICGIALVVIISYISSYPERKRLREQAEARKAESTMVKEILNGFDVKAEREKIIQLLKDSLPDGYRCGKRGCDGILLKQSNNFGGGYYICSKCHNFRSTIRMPKVVNHARL